jgi:hypothetical protein
MNRYIITEEELSEAIDWRTTWKRVYEIADKVRKRLVPDFATHFAEEPDHFTSANIERIPE